MLLQVVRFIATGGHLQALLTEELSEHRPDSIADENVGDDILLDEPERRSEDEVVDGAQHRAALVLRWIPKGEASGDENSSSRTENGAQGQKHPRAALLSVVSTSCGDGGYMLALKMRFLLGWSLLTNHTSFSPSELSLR